MSETPAAPPPPPVAAEVFGEQLPLAERYVRLLADTGISHGLIGPREGPRLWERHVLNCAVVERLVPRVDGQRLVDVGSGAGLPGIAIAIARPDLEVHLVEPLARRTAWLEETVAELGLPNVTVHTCRAEDLWEALRADWVTARAVAGIVQLAEWCLPLLAAGGSLLALKGSKAYDELEENRTRLARLGVTDAAIREVGGDVLAEPTTVVHLSVDAPVDTRTFRRRTPTSSGSARRRSDRKNAGDAADASRGRGAAGGKSRRDPGHGGGRGRGPSSSRRRGGPDGQG